MAKKHEDHTDPHHKPKPHDHGHDEQKPDPHHKEKKTAKGKKK